MRNIAWGLQPGSLPVDAGAVDQALMGLEVMALGSRILTHVWSGPNDDLASLPQAADLQWIVTIATSSVLASDDAALSEALDRIWGLGSRVRYLIVGEHLEAELASLSDPEREAAVGRIVGLLTRARSHDLRTAGSLVGVGVETMAGVPASLLSVLDVVALSYSGVETGGEVSSPKDASTLVQIRAKQVSDLGYPVIFQDLAYPSANGEQRQSEFFSALRDWVSQPKVPDLRAVVVSSLNPPSAEECDAWAAEWAASDGAARCSVGMRDANGKAKAALNEVIALLAEFAQL